MECPVTYCAQRPNVTWCKYSGKNCLPLEIGPRQHTGWEDKVYGSVFTLHFEPVYPSDVGSYSCSVNFNSVVINSNIIALHVTESRCSGMDWNQMTQSSSLPMTEISTTLFVQMGEKALLHCPAFPMTETVLITWVIVPRGQPPCRIIYIAETKINETNCTDKRITWASTPDQSPDLQINAAAVDHDGLYSCDILTPQGNFQESHDLHVLVPPAVTLLPGENRTAVCEAIAGKPAAQIFWSPDGNHVTMQESHSNGTVTVRSTYLWEQNNVSAVFCFVSHPTGNQTLSIELNQGVTSTLHSLLIIPCVKLALLGIILLILGFAFFQKRNYFR
ncbi:cell surface glycoprotein CD200 receptor 2-like [Microtus pennsylvanicus]|uniref:cell surface glycoprotein CD200 receptor 2-like n=1 Tax=Microtus pennsylvanicus TaxID=10058 RepID=UPI003F6BFB28